MLKPSIKSVIGLSIRPIFGGTFVPPNWYDKTTGIINCEVTIVDCDEVILCL